MRVSRLVPLPALSMRSFCASAMVWLAPLSNLLPQVEMTHNALLDACERFREDMGEVTDNVSLATALETLWAERVEAAAAARANLF